MDIRYMAKAVVALCSTAAGALVTAVAQDGITGAEMAITVLSAISAGALVFATKNSPARRKSAPGGAAAS